jgi:hypothetical protein
MAYYRHISLYLRVQKQNVTNHLSESGFEGIIGKLSSSTAKKMPACAFPFLKLCRKHARTPWQSNIAQHCFLEIGDGVRFAPKRYHGQANKYIYVMLSSANLPSLSFSCYVVHKLSHAAGYLGHTQSVITSFVIARVMGGGATIGGYLYNSSQLSIPLNNSK